jgi:adenine-specific DNA-methyltransferase
VRNKVARIDVTRTELVWPGKYDEDGNLREVPRVSLPFQVIETINESRATREARKSQVQGTLFDVWNGDEGDTFEEGWKNKLIWGDNLLVMGSLLERFTGKIDLIYIDPPFATGADFSFTTEIGEGDLALQKEQSIIEEKAYRDTWGRGIDSYISMMYSRLALLRDLLSEQGSIYVHCDFRVNSYIRLMLDSIFGREHFLNEVIWNYATGGAGRETYARKHDTIFFYSKTPSYKFFPDRVREPRTEKAMRRAQNPKGARIVASDDTKLPTDVWPIAALNPMARERLNYPTQKPEELLEKIILASSDENDLVADFFCGSGTTLAVAERVGRRWIGCDLSRFAVHVTRKRLLDREGCTPFEVLNLGKYERQYWQSIMFGNGNEDRVDEQSIYEYLAFILKLYKAHPLSGLLSLHGKKGNAMVHIGAVDAPVTISEVEMAVDECLRLKQRELHVLGWEWQMGMYDLMIDAAKKKGVKLLLLQIPREVMEQQAAEKGDTRFFELAYLDIDFRQPKKSSVQVALQDFVIPNTELIPEEVRDKIRKWSDYIDYWAIDWDFQNDTFMQGWVAYRTRKDRTLALSSDEHKYDKPGTYRIVVKVIDIFGNDTSQAVDVEVK